MTFLVLSAIGLIKIGIKKTSARFSVSINTGWENPIWFLLRRVIQHFVTEVNSTLKRRENEKEKKEEKDSLLSLWQGFYSKAVEVEPLELPFLPSSTLEKRAESTPIKEGVGLNLI